MFLILFFIRSWAAKPSKPVSGNSNQNGQSNAGQSTLVEGQNGHGSISYEPVNEPQGGNDGFGGGGIGGGDPSGPNGSQSPAGNGGHSSSFTHSSSHGSTTHTHSHEGR